MEKGVSNKVSLESILQKALNGNELSFMYMTGLEQQLTNIWARMTINNHFGANNS